MVIVALIFVVYIALVAAFTIGYYKVIERKPIPSSNFQFISVVICFRNEEENIPRLIQSLQTQSYPREYFEIIAVNDHSTDNTQKLLMDAQAELPNLRIYSLSKIDRGKKKALLRGVQMAQGVVIAATDADCLLPQGWLTNINQLMDMRTDLVCGPVVYSKGGFFENMAAVEFGSLVASGIGAAGAGLPIYCNGANLAFKKELFLAANLRNDSTPSGDDVFLLHYAKQNHRAIAFSHGVDSTVHTTPDSNLRSFINRRLRWGSKTPHYTDTFTQVVAVTVLLTNLSVLGLALAALVSSAMVKPFIILFTAKAILDYGLIAVHFKSCRIKKWTKYYLPTMVLYPFYITFTAFASLRKEFTWKERQYS